MKRGFGGLIVLAAAAWALAVVFSEFDEFAAFMWGVPAAADIEQGEKLMTLFGTDRPVVEGQRTGKRGATGKRDQRDPIARQGVHEVVHRVQRVAQPARREVLRSHTERTIHHDQVRHAERAQGCDRLGGKRRLERVHHQRQPAAGSRLRGNGRDS